MASRLTQGAWLRPRAYASETFIAVVTVAVLAAGCGGGAQRPTAVASSSTSADHAPLPPEYVPVPAGRGRGYRLPAVGPAVRQRVPIAGLRCAIQHPRAYGVHVELYAHRLVVLVPAGIGIAPPGTRRGVYVLGGACTYPIRTTEPTGVVVVDAATTPPNGARGASRFPAQTRVPTLGTLFAVWGQPITSTGMAGFRGRVVAFLGGRRWSGRPEQIPLTRHAEIVLQVAGAVPAHRTYRFAPGL